MVRVVLTGQTICFLGGLLTTRSTFAGPSTYHDHLLRVGGLLHAVGLVLTHNDRALAEMVSWFVLYFNW